MPVQIDEDGRSWAPLTDLLNRYQIVHRWDNSQRRILVGSSDVVPTFRADAVQASIGWPLVELTLETEHAPVILTGILRQGSDGDRAWCRVVEFAEEFGISVDFDPLVLRERRGG